MVAASGALSPPALAAQQPAYPPLTITGRVQGLDGQPQPGVVVSLKAIDAAGNTFWEANDITAGPQTRPGASLKVVDGAGKTLSQRKEVGVGPAGSERLEGTYVLFYPGTALTPKPARFRLEIARARLEVGRARILGVPLWHKHRWVQAQSRELNAAAFESLGWSVTHQDFALAPDPFPPLYTFLLFAPALCGLLAATGALIWYGVYRNRKGIAEEKAKWGLSAYTAVGATTWVATLIFFAVGYAQDGLGGIRLFGPDISVSVLVPAAAFLGVLVYATTCLIAVVTTDGNVKYHEKLIELGNRVFIAPYVALIAVVAAFRGETGDWKAAVLAFATGVWIEPVLGALQVAGAKLVPERDPGVQRDGARAPTSAAAPAGPSVGHITFTASTPTTLQRGQQFGVTGSVTGTGATPLMYEIDWGDGSPATAGTLTSQGGPIAATHTYAAPGGPFHARLNVTDGNGTGASSDTIAVTVT